MIPDEVLTRAPELGPVEMVVWTIGPNGHKWGTQIPDFRYTPADPHNSTNVRSGSLADVLRLPPECLLSGVKQT